MCKLVGGIGVTPMISTFHELASRMSDNSLVMTSQETIPDSFMTDNVTIYTQLASMK
jgi:ferredoxin-NADP reductase